MNNVLQKAQKIATTNLGAKISGIKLESSINEVDMTNLVMDWEEELQMEILNQEAKETITVQDTAYIGYDLSILATNEEDEEEDEDYDEEDEEDEDEEEDEE